MTGVGSGQVERTERIAAEPVESLAALLDVDVPDGAEVPPLWHWLYLLERPATRDLGPDGHRRSGVPAPPEPGMRRMFAGGTVETHRLLRIGEPATRTTWLAEEVEKDGRTGRLRFVTVCHEIRQAGALAVAEEQHIVYRAPGGPLPEHRPEALPSREPALCLAVDEALLFRFSALTYNAHRIHYDRAWCRKEGYADLVVHGPLQALMMGELARRNGVPLLGRRFEYRLVGPMVGPQAMHVLPGAEGVSRGAEVRTPDGRRTAVAQLTSLGDSSI